MSHDTKDPLYISKEVADGLASKRTEAQVRALRAGRAPSETDPHCRDMGKLMLFLCATPGRLL